MKIPYLAVVSALALALQLTHQAAATTYSQKDTISYGYSLLAHGSPSTAVQVFVGVLKVEPGNLIARRYLAHALVQSGNYQQAISQFIQLSKYMALQAVDVSGLAEAYLKSGEHKLALSYYEQALKLDPTFGPALVGSVKAHMAMSQNTEALAECEKGLQRVRDAGSKGQLEEIFAQLKGKTQSSDGESIAERPAQPG